MCCVPILSHAQDANDSSSTNTSAKTNTNTKLDQKKFEALKAQIELLKKELEQTKSSRDGIHESLEKNEKAIGELKGKTEKLKHDIDQNTESLEILEDERSGLLQKKTREETRVREYLSSAYQLGKQDQIRMILNQQEPEELARMLFYFERFSQSRSKNIEAFRKTINQLNALKPKIQEKSLQLQSSLTNLKREQSSLKQSQQDRQRNLAKLNVDLRNQQGELNALQQDRRRLEKLLSKMVDVISEQELAISHSEFIGAKGSLPWPTRGKVSNRYGSARSGNSLRWQGYKIPAAAGSRVIAIHHGQVVFSDYLRGHGLLLIIDHGAGYMSLYAHNQSLHKETGSWVETGELIAAVGNSGGQKDNALYFELRHNGKATNPKHWLQSS
ncbi:MAG: septal ring factor EnvC (AmiA/AmiB activator) [Flavobacteriales bacterium]|jgi:septal ring factor EnvC (AmiA/AmiB activator)